MSLAGIPATCRRGTRSNRGESFQHWFSRPGLFVATLVRHVAIALEVGVLVDPSQRSAHFVLELADELGVAGPSLVVVEQHDEQLRRVGRAEVRRMRSLLERGHLAVAHLVEDPARFLFAEVVDARALSQGQLAQRRGRQLLREGQGLQAREDAVASEHRHEPRQPCRGQRVATGAEGRESQRGEVDEAAPIGVLQRVAVATRAAAHARPTASDPAPRSSACAGRAM